MRNQKRTIEREILAELRETLVDQKRRLRLAKQRRQWSVVAETDAYIMGLQKALFVIDSVNRAHDNDWRVKR